MASKDATGDVYAAAKLAASTGLAFYSGDDGLLLPFLAHGAAGIVSVSAHAVAPQFAEVVRRFDAGDPAGALEVFLTTTPVIDALNGAGFQAVMAKAAVELLGVTDNRFLRLPNVAATEDDVALVRDALAAAGVLAGVPTAAGAAAPELARAGALETPRLSHDRRPREPSPPRTLPASRAPRRRAAHRRPRRSR